jgi:hypothetical protein
MTLDSVKLYCVIFAVKISRLRYLAAEHERGVDARLHPGVVTAKPGKACWRRAIGGASQTAAQVLRALPCRIADVAISGLCSSVLSGNLSSPAHV